jgi:hypothetical protein
MSNELSEERRRLIYRYMQDGETTDAVARERERPTLPPPLPEAMMLPPERPRQPEREPLLVAAPAAPLWQRRLLHLRHRYARESGAVALVAFASAVGWLVAHVG